MDPISLVQAEVENICKTFGPFNGIWDALYKVLKYYETKKVLAPNSVIKHAVRMSYRKLTYNSFEESFKLKIMIKGKRLKGEVKLGRPTLKFLYKLLIFCRENKMLEIEETYYKFAKYIVGYVGGTTYDKIKQYLERLSNIVLVDTINKSHIGILSVEFKDDKIRVRINSEFFALVEYMNFDFKELVLFFQASKHKITNPRKEE